MLENSNNESIIEKLIACHTNHEIQLNVNKSTIQVEQKPNIKIGITSGFNFMKQFMEKLKSGEIKIETCLQVEIGEELTKKFILQQLEKYQKSLDDVGIIDEIPKREQGPILKKTRK